MSKYYSIILITLIVLLGGCQKENGHIFQNGDILFQSLNSPQCQAVKIATGSQYSHCGMINIIDGKVFVLEGLQPTMLTPIDEWIKRGIDEHYAVKRLKDLSEQMPAQVKSKVVSVGSRYLGKDYDIYFGWSDSLIYCSELVWKVYKEAWGIELCPLRKLKDFNLSHPVVQAKLHERYGDNFPLEEPVVAPSDLFDSELLEEVVIESVTQ